MRLYLGIDPGLTGGIAWISEAGTMSAVKMPPTEGEILDQLRDVTALGEPVCALEKVHAMPRQGVSSTFKFGMGYGFLRGCLLALEIPWMDVPPGVWQRTLQCLSKGDKRVTRQRARQMWPHIRVTNAIADAMLIAEYCRRKWGK